MKKVILLTALSVSFLLTASNQSSARTPDGIGQEKQPVPKKRTTGSIRSTGGGGTGGSQPDTTVAPPIPPVRHRMPVDSKRKIKRLTPAKPLQP